MSTPWKRMPEKLKIIADFNYPKHLSLSLNLLDLQHLFCVKMSLIYK